MNYPIITKIIETKQENSDVKTFKFEYPEKITPGQFFMVWIPGVDEIPLSVSYINKSIKGITFKRVGEATNSLFYLKKGDRIGIKGPYGNGFKLDKSKILFVAGGTGIATIGPAIEAAIKKSCKTTVILGVKTKNELFFEERFKKCGTEIYISTDDGTEGFKGLASNLTEKILTEKNFDSILTCGPEKMMYTLFKMCKSTPFQASLERYMKCGFGICGQCCVGKGLRVCEEGPVFDGKTLKNIDDFGFFKRDPAGRKIKF